MAARGVPMDSERPVQVGRRVARWVMWSGVARHRCTGAGGCRDSLAPAMPLNPTGLGGRVRAARRMLTLGARALHEQCGRHLPRSGRRRSPRKMQRSRAASEEEFHVDTTALTLAHRSLDVAFMAGFAHSGYAACAGA